MTIYSRPMRFDMICDADGIKHRLANPNTRGPANKANG